MKKVSEVHVEMFTSESQLGAEDAINKDGGIGPQIDDFKAANPNKGFIGFSGVTVFQEEVNGNNVTKVMAHITVTKEDI